MPISRYEIRNEYSLADPELYLEADKDDPEALLEAVAMAGLVGVLRQLGDLAEFAAEIFHDLHEEVMATAARGHSLIIRVEQLEAEVPSIEKAFLSQTDHSSFFYSAGADWHPHSRITQNLVTQGDIPRFVMDSYEECRGPPRLFLLDKFDVAGAGACLKRYTDPSIFKVETSAMANADVRREKKIRKAKKKWPRGVYGETPEGFPASHAKLHQLFLEEPDQNCVKKRAHRAKLKRRLNGFPFDSRTGKSYMEKLLKSPSAEDTTLLQITASSPFFIMSTDNHKEDEIKSGRPGRDSEGRKIKFPPPFINQIDDKSVGIKSCDVPSYLNVVTENTEATFNEENDEKDINVNGERKTEGSLTGYQSDKIASERDSYMDAPSTIELEMDTDSEKRVKNDIMNSFTKSQPSVSVESEEHVRWQSSNSQSTGDLTISRTVGEHPQSENTSSERFLSADIPETALDNAPDYKKTADENSPRDVLPYNRTSIERLISDSSTSNSVHVSPHNDSGVVVRKGRLTESKPEKMASTPDDEGNNTVQIINSQHSRGGSSSKSLPGNDSPRSASGEHLLDGKDASCRSNISGIITHTSDTPAAEPANLLPEDDNDLADLNQLGNINSALDMSCVLSQKRINTEEVRALEEHADKVSEFPENFASDLTDIEDSREDITLRVPQGEKKFDNLNIQESTISSDAPNCLSSITEISTGMEITETLFTNTTTDTEEHYSNNLVVKQISSKTLIVSEGLDAHGRDLIPEEQTTIDDILKVEPPNSCEVVGLTCDVTPDNLVSVKSSFYMPEPPGASDSDTKLGYTWFNNPSYIELRSKVHVLLDESEAKTDQWETAFADDNTGGNVGLPLSIHTLVEDHSSCFKDSDLSEHKDGNTGLSGSNVDSELVEEDEIFLGRSDLVEEVDESEAASLDHPKSEVPDTIFNFYLDSDIEQSVGFLATAQFQSPLEQSGLVLEHDSLPKNGLDSHIYVTEETVLQEKIELASDKIDKESPEVDEISTELTSLSPINQHMTIDHYNDEGCNNFASSFLLDNSPTSVSSYPKDPLVISLPPNQISLDDLPPLPPLPPLQWRMGMLQHASSATELNETECEDVFPEETSLSAASTGNLSSSLEPVNHSLVQEISVKEESVMQSSPSLKSNSMNVENMELSPKMENRQQWQQPVISVHTSDEVASSAALACVEIISMISLQENNVEKSFPPEIENEEQQQIVTPTQKRDELASFARLVCDENFTQTSLKEVCVVGRSPSIRDNYMHERTVLPPKREKELQLTMPTQNSSEVASSAEEDGVSDGSRITKLPLYREKELFPIPTPKSNDVSLSADKDGVAYGSQSADLPTMIEKEKQLAMPSLKSEEVTSSADEDGVADGNRKMNLPRACNPLIGSAAALDKSKLRKVTARDRPQIQKPDERDSLLEQIRAKSFSLKPAVTSKPTARGPNTNLKVAAILEKANAIRQALAGSDEDDEDSWSDS